MSPALHSFRNNHIITFLKKISSTENYPPPPVSFICACAMPPYKKGLQKVNTLKKTTVSLSPLINLGVGGDYVS